MVLHHLADAGLTSWCSARGGCQSVLGAAQFGEELALTSNKTSWLGLRAWSTKTGELFAELPCGTGKRIAQAGSLLGVKATCLQRWVAALIRHLEVITFGR